MNTSLLERVQERTSSSPKRPPAIRRLASPIAEAGLARIAQPYLLVLFGVHFHIDAEGRRHIDPLWAKDLVAHTHYIERLTLASPALHGTPPSDWVAMDSVDALRGVRCVDLPLARGYLGALAQLPRMWRILAAECKRARIVHSSVAGWPLPEAWVLAPLLMWQPRPHYIHVESAFWRLVPGQAASRKRRLVAWATERLNRWAVSAADLSTFTQDSYRRSLLRRNSARGQVVEASWIDEVDILSSETLAATLRERSAIGPLRLVFAGRLTQAKGILLLLDAVTALLREGHAIELDVFGEGPLAVDCAARLAEPALMRSIRLHGNVAYGATFFETLRAFHVLVVPSLSDEQPRVVFDAYAQGLPVLASDTAGLLQCVAPGRTGSVFESGNLDALKAAIVCIAADRKGLTAMAKACIAQAHAQTHGAMHRKRQRLLLAAFPSLARR